VIETLTKFLLFATPFFKNLNSLVQERIQGGDLGFKTLPLMERFFNLLGLLEKKIPKHPPKFCHPYKKIQKFWLLPWFSVERMRSENGKHWFKSQS